MAEGSERLFIGVPIPGKTRLSLMRQLPEVLPGRASPPENWHFTLRFLGSTAPEQRDRLIEHLGSAELGDAFDIEFDTLGAFPNARRARVVWAGVGNGHARLERVAMVADSAAESAGFDPEKRKFSAHLTISRLKRPESVTQFLVSAGRIEAAMSVESILLYRSVPGGQHSRYSVVAEFPLGS
jgi:2'-5' RNA ligase